jgi:hypothetical protein
MAGTDTMEHSEAIETMAAERYALGELTGAERDAFEEHFFDCAECAMSVRDGAAITTGLRSLGLEEARPVRTAARGRASWLGFAAAAALAAVIVYQNVAVIPTLREAAGMPLATIAHQTFLSSGMRGATGELQTITVAANEPVCLNFDIIPPDVPATSYRCEVRDAAGNVKITVPIDAEQAKETVPLLIRPGVLSAGRYDLVILSETPARSEIARHPFELQVR